jgi:serine/threonine-protein kinase
VRFQPLTVFLVLVSFGLAGALFWALGRFSAASPPEPTQVSVTLPPNHELTTWGFAISPNGRDLVYVAVVGTGGVSPEEGRPQLFHRNLGDSSARPLPGTEGARAPFFSPDGEWVAFASVTDLKLKKISLRGGGPVVVADLPGSSIESPGAWTADGHILFGDRTGPVRRVPADGGPSEIVVPRTALEAGEQGMLSPTPLPGGSGTMFNPRFDFGVLAVYLGGRRQTLLKDAFQPRFTPHGQLLFWRSAGSAQVDLWAVGFDADRAELKGAPMSVLTVTGSNQFSYALSRSGTLVYRVGDPEYRRGRFEWVSLDDRPLPPRLKDPPATVSRISGPRVSPDGRLVLYHVVAGPNDVRLLVADLEAAATRILATGQHFWAIWTPDGRRVIYQEPPDAAGGAGLVWKPADGSAAAERLTSSKTWQQPQFVTRDGRFLVYQEGGGIGTRDASTEDNYDLWLKPLDPRGDARPLLRTKANEKLPYLSPDERWMAYVSDESGREEIWVRAFPPEGSAAIQVSQGGGTEPVWAPDGKTLYYRDAAGMRIYAVPVTHGAVPQFGVPTVRNGRWAPAFPFGRLYDISPDGRAMLLQSEPTAGRELNVILNFDEVIRRKVAEAKK